MTRSGSLRLLAFVLVLVLTLGVSSCGKRTQPLAQPADAAIVDASPPAPPPKKLVDLLHFSPAIVAVSSKVDNPKDFPAHLVDGKLDTAWNGKTGDLESGWVAFRVPLDTRVKRIELTSGFVKKSGDKDLFAMNVRIKRVRLRRGFNGPVIKEATLDPESRDMQGIDLDEPGGDFRIEVVEVVPGTRADYKELTVSELSVIGIGGKDQLDHLELPRVYVGSLDADLTPPPKKKPPPPADPLSPGPHPTPAAFCVAQKKAAAPGIFKLWGNGERYPGEVEPSCRIEKLDVKSTLSPPFLAATRYEANEPNFYMAGILLKTDAGWFQTPWTLWTHAHDDPGCMHTSNLKILELTSPDPTLPVAWMRMVWTESFWMQLVPLPDGRLSDASSSWTTWEETLGVCRVDASGSFACDKTVTLASAREESGGPDATQRKAPFKTRKTPHIGDAGVIELQ